MADKTHAIDAYKRYIIFGIRSKRDLKKSPIQSNNPNNIEVDILHPPSSIFHIITNKNTNYNIFLKKSAYIPPNSKYFF